MPAVVPDHHLGAVARERGLDVAAEACGHARGGRVKGTRSAAAWHTVAATTTAALTVRPLDLPLRHSASVSAPYHQRQGALDNLQCDNGNGTTSGAATATALPARRHVEHQHGTHRLRWRQQHGAEEIWCHVGFKKKIRKRGQVCASCWRTLRGLQHRQLVHARKPSTHRGTQTCSDTSCPHVPRAWRWEERYMGVRWLVGRAP